MFAKCSSFKAFWGKEFIYYAVGQKSTLKKEVEDLLFHREEMTDANLGPPALHLVNLS